MMSYDLMLDFYGIKLKDPLTGELERAKNYKLRYYHSILNSYHNHLRISRILSCLNVTGFRSHAIKLVEFLLREIEGNKREKEEGLDPPLEELKKCSSVKFWLEYGEIETHTDK